MNKMTNDDLRTRQERAVGREVMKIWSEADPSLAANLATIDGKRSDLTPEQAKAAFTLRYLWDIGCQSIGKQLLEAAEAEVN